MERGTKEKKTAAIKKFLLIFFSAFSASELLSFAPAKYPIANDNKVTPKTQDQTDNDSP